MRTSIPSTRLRPAGIADLRRSALSVAAAVSLALFAAACTTTGQPTATSATPRGPTVAFESIDGPPESVFHRLVQTLSDEAEARQMAVVSRTGAAQYRVRSYIAAQSQGKTSTISWVWDVYDADHRRAIRITGEEPAGSSGTGTWAIADEAVLRRLANSGMNHLAAFLAAPGPQSQPPAPAEQVRPATTVAAAADDFAPESAGIFRTAARAAGNPDSGAAAAATIPTPPRRPAGAGFAPADNLAYLASGH